jgi:hypothetical protein
LLPNLIENLSRKLWVEWPKAWVVEVDAQYSWKFQKHGKNRFLNAIICQCHQLREQKEDDEAKRLKANDGKG